MRTKNILKFSILAVVTLATGCGGYSDDEVAQARVDSARQKIRPTATDGLFDRAPGLQTAEANGGQPLNLIPSDKLVPLNTANGFEGVSEDAYGAAIAISGNTVAVGAPDRDDIGSNSGAVYIYVNDNGAWTLEQKLIPKDGATNDNFGFSLALEGNRLLIGSRRGGSGGAPQSGAVYIYERSGKVWTRTKKLDPANTGFEDFFGYAVALHQDYALVGAPQLDNAGAKTGAAFLYQYNGTDWVQLKQFLPATGTANDFYGAAVALLPPTGAFSVTALVAAWDDDQAPGENDGAVYAYVDPDPVNNGQSWGLQAKLVASDQTPGDTFGFALSAAGQRAYISAPFRSDTCDNSGAVYVFNRHSGVWCEEAIITPYDKNAGQFFGYSVAGLKETVAIGSAYDDDGGDYSGSAYVYSYKDSNWEPQLKFVPDGTSPLQLVGFSVAMDGDKVATGALGDITNNINSGSAYVFSATGAAPAAPPVMSLKPTTENAQCSFHGGSSSSRSSSWFIGIAIAALGMRRTARRVRFARG